MSFQCVQFIGILHIPRKLSGKYRVPVRLFHFSRLNQLRSQGMEMDVFNRDISQWSTQFSKMFH